MPGTAPSAEDVFLLHSNPGASKVHFLDFDGHTTRGTNWNLLVGGGSIVSAPYNNRSGGA